MTGLRVLVVDDEVDAAYIVSVLIELQGHTCATALTGQDAIAMAATFDPQLAIIDIGLPDLSGFEVARALRAQPREGRLFLAALSGWGSDQDRKAALAAGFDQHITKPADLRKLRDILDRAQRQSVGSRGFVALR